MERLLQQIKQLLPREKKFLYQIYEKVIRDHGYLWEELEDIEKLRQILLVIIKLFIEEHKQLRDLSQIDQEELARDFRRLLSSRDALLQKGRQHQIDEIEAIGIERWIEQSWNEINKINKLIEFYEKDKGLPLFKPEDINHVVDKLGRKGIESKIKPLVISLWRLGIKTKNSCHGHVLRAQPYPFVEIALGQDTSKLQKLVNDFNRSSDVRWELTKIKSFVGDEQKLRSLSLQNKDEFDKYIKESQVSGGFRLKPVNTPEKATFGDKLKITFTLGLGSSDLLEKLRKSAIDLAEFIERQRKK
ncbi:hypothetical protein HYX00_00550 [Candidatus Woesearchaeota archaeon]|nr:hypothetical protein [Candidatus Woesearchaeota archaeon]